MKYWIFSRIFISLCLIECKVSYSQTIHKDTANHRKDDSECLREKLRNLQDRQQGRPTAEINTLPFKSGGRSSALDQASSTNMWQHSTTIQHKILHQIQYPFRVHITKRGPKRSQRKELNLSERNPNHLKTFRSHFFGSTRANP